MCCGHSCQSIFCSHLGFLWNLFREICWENLQFFWLRYLVEALNFGVKILSLGLAERISARTFVFKRSLTKVGISSLIRREDYFSFKDQRNIEEYFSNYFGNWMCGTTQTWRATTFQNLTIFYSKISIWGIF